MYLHLSAIAEFYVVLRWNFLPSAHANEYLRIFNQINIEPQSILRPATLLDPFESIVEVS